MRPPAIFLVEDETLIRMMLVQIVEELGYKVVAEAASVNDGCSRAEVEDYDLAILDVNLQGFNVRPVAQAISRRGLPFVFLTGYGPRGLPEEFIGLPVLAKPCTPDALKSTIEAVLSQRGRQVEALGQGEEPEASGGQRSDRIIPTPYYC